MVPFNDTCFMCLYEKNALLSVINLLKAILRVKWGEAAILKFQLSPSPPEIYVNLCKIHVQQSVPSLPSNISGTKHQTKIFYIT